jgi:aerobic-type carbon monoxide dehydrogenase small subunit (CoxS/CutS family)
MGDNSKMQVSIHLNGQEIRADVEGGMLLVEFIR